jgi:outer membrane protein OmpA-like peptidoglycan-associated protein
VVPRTWTPPPTFVTPPGWYYLPRDEYVTYNYSNPTIVQCIPGAARQDLIAPINEEASYTPSEEVAEEITEEDVDTGDMDRPERPLPEEPPALETDADVDELVRELTRERDPEFRYAGPVVATQLVQFEDDGYAILPQSFEFLDNLGEALLEPALENAIVSIETHMNGTVEDDAARTLTERRSWAVKGYLVQKYGIDPNRIEYFGYGNDAPIAPHDTDDGLAMNERLEIENVSDLLSALDENDPAPDADQPPASAEPAPSSRTQPADEPSTAAVTPVASAVKPGPGTSSTLQLMPDSLSPDGQYIVGFQQSPAPVAQLTSATQQTSEAAAAAYLVRTAHQQQLLRMPELDACYAATSAWPHPEFYWNNASTLLAIQLNQRLGEKLYVYSTQDQPTSVSLPDLTVDGVIRQLKLPLETERGNHDGSGLEVKRWRKDDLLELNILQGHRAEAEGDPNWHPLTIPVELDFSRPGVQLRQRSRRGAATADAQTTGAAPAP